MLAADFEPYTFDPYGDAADVDGSYWWDASFDDASFADEYWDGADVDDGYWWDTPYDDVSFAEEYWDLADVDDGYGWDASYEDVSFAGEYWDAADVDGGYGWDASFDAAYEHDVFVGVPVVDGSGFGDPGPDDPAVDEPELNDQDSLGTAVESEVPVANGAPVGADVAGGDVAAGDAGGMVAGPAIGEANFFNTADNFWLPELAWWPETPAVYDPEIAALPGLPAGLQVLELPLPVSSAAATPQAASSAYNDATAAARSAYDQAVAAAEAEHAAAMTAAGANRANATSAARSAKQAALDGFTAAALDSLQRAVEVADSAWQAEVQRVTQAAEQELTASLEANDAVRASRDYVAEAALHTAYAAAQEASMNTQMAIELRHMEALQRRDDGEITEAEFAAVAAATSAELQAELRRLAVELSGYRETYDNALIEHAAAESVANAAAQQVAAVRIAGAAQAEQTTLVQAKRNLAIAQIANHYGQKRTASAAKVHYQRELAAAGKVYAEAKADADADKAIAIQTAAADHSEALATASAALSIAIAQHTAASITAAHAGDDSAAAAYRIAAAHDQRDHEVRQAETLRDQQHAMIAADLALDVALLRARAERAKDDASADQRRENELADAASTFRSAYIDLLQRQAADAHDFQADAQSEREEARRQFDISMAAVQQTRATRNTIDLKPNRQALALAENKRSHDLISQQTFQAEVDALAREGKELRIQIAQDTFGSPSSSFSSSSSSSSQGSGGATESGARESWLAENNRAANQLAQQQRAQQAEATQLTAALSLAHDQDVAQAQRDYQVAISEANRASASRVLSALESWIGAIATAQADYQAELAAAEAAQTIAISRAAVDFYTASSRSRAAAIAAYAASSDHPWAAREAAVAAAEAARVAAVGNAYTSLVVTTANASAAAVGDAAAAHASFIAASTIAQLAADAAAQAAIAMHQTRIADAAETRDNDFSSAVSSFDATVAEEQQSWRDTTQQADVLRSAGYFAALLTNIFSSLSGSHVASVAQAARRALEVSAGTTYADTAIAANQDYLHHLADENKALHDARAGARESLEIASADSLETLQHALTGAEQAAALQMADAQATFSIAVAGVSATHDSALLRADRDFTVSVSDADRIYARAVTTAELAFDVALARRKLGAVVDWAATQRDAQGRILPPAQYSVAVHDATLTWHVAAAPVLQTYRDAIADQTHRLTVAAADASLLAALERVRADEALDTTLAGAEEMLVIDAARANWQRDRAFASSQASLGRASAALAKTFADAFAAGRHTLQSDYADESAASEQTLVGHRSQLHMAAISQFDYQVRAAENYDFLTLALAAIDRDFASERAAATEQWGHDFADELHDGFMLLVEPAGAAQHGAVDAYEAAHNLIARAGEAHTVELARSDAWLAIVLADAEAEFDHSAAIRWATLVQEIGELDVDFARATAAAEVAHHVAVAEHAAEMLTAQFGNQPDREQRFAIRVANARTTFFRSVADDYIDVMAATAEQNRDAAVSSADADAAFQAALGAATVAYVTATQNAFAAGIADVAGESTVHTAALLSDLSAWVRATVAADNTRQTTLASAYRTAARDFASAEAAAYRGAANHAYAMMRDEIGQTLESGQMTNPTAPGGYLDHYNRDLAAVHYTVASANADAGGAYGVAIATAEQQQVARLAAASHRATGAEAAAQYRLDTAINDALRDLRNASDDAGRRRDRTLAQADRDRVVASAVTIRDALMSQYTAARDIYRSFSDISDGNVRYAIAQVKGAYAYAQSLLPQFITVQTTVADANLAFAYSVIDADREHRQNLTDAAHRHGARVAADQRSVSEGRSSLWHAAVNAGAAATADYKSAVATAGADYAASMATLRRDAAIAAGWGGPAVLDQQAVAAANSARSAATATATGAQEQAMTSARDAYFRGLALSSRESEQAAADRDHAFSLAAIESLARLRAEAIDAEHTAAGIEIDARHDYRIADIEAVIAGLTAVRNHFNTTATEQARVLAVTARGDRVAAVDAERAAAHRAIAETRSAAASATDSEKSAAIGEANMAGAERKSEAQAGYDEATSSWALAHAQLPRIANDQPIGLGIAASLVPFMGDSLTLVDSVTAALSFAGGETFAIGTLGGSGRTVAGVAGGLYERTGLASAADMTRFVIQAEISYQADRIRRLPGGDELVHYAGITWSLTRQQAAANAQAVHNWGVSAGTSLAAGGAEGGTFWYWAGMTLGSYAEGGASILSALIVDPLSTAEGLAGAVEAHYQAGGTLAVVGMFTGGLALYESITGADFLTGEALSGDQRFDRAWLGTTGIMTSVGGSAILRHAAQHGIRATIDMIATAPKNVLIGAKPVALKGVAFEGNIYRAPYPGTSPTVIDHFNIAANHRYSAPGEGALYFSTNSRTVIQELGGSFVGGRTMDTFNVKLDNLLDLSDPSIRASLGVSLDDLVRTTGADIYDVTQQLGRYARQQGYRGLIVPSARADGGLNIVLFQEL